MTTQAAQISVDDLLLVPELPLIAALNSRWDEAAIVLGQEQDGARSPSARLPGQSPPNGPWPFTAILGEITASCVDERGMAELLAAWVDAREHRGEIHVHTSVIPRLGRTEKEVRRAFESTSIANRCRVHAVKRCKSPRAILRSIRDRIAHPQLGRRLFARGDWAPTVTTALHDFCTWDLRAMDPSQPIELSPLLDALAIYAEAAFTADGGLR